MAFSPEDKPEGLDDSVLWQIADGAAGIEESVNYLLRGVRSLRQERDDALAAATHYGAEVESLRAELAEEKRKNQAAADVFGGALASVDHLTNVRGPNRPNRRKLSAWEASQVRVYAQNSGAKVKDIARRWGVHSSTISRILNGKAY